jgi:hypothetical protein
VSAACADGTIQIAAGHHRVAAALTGTVASALKYVAKAILLARGENFLGSLNLSLFVEG